MLTKLRKYLRIGAALLVVVVALIALAPTIVSHTSLASWVARRALKGINGSIRVGSMSLGWFKPVTVRDVELRDDAGRPLLTAPVIAGSKTLLQLIRDSSDLGTFRCEQPALHLVFEGAQSNLEKLLASLPTGDPAKPAPSSPRPALTLEVVDARVQVEDADTKRSWQLSAIGASIALPRDGSQPVVARLQATLPDAGRIDTEVSVVVADDPLKSTGQLVAKVEGLPLAMFGSVLRRQEPGAYMEGQLSTRVDCRWSPDAQGQPVVRVEGQVEARKLDVSATALGPDHLRLERLDLPCRLALHGDCLHIEKLQVECDLGKVWAAGTVGPTDGAMSLIVRPGQAVGADIDLAKLVAMLPNVVLLQNDTRLTAGRLSLQASSIARNGETVWNASLRTSDLRGISRGHAIAIPEPIAVTLAARKPASALPVVDQLRCESGFLQVSGAGSLDQLTLTASCDLGRLAAQLGQFIDFGPVKLAGQGTTQLTARRRNDGGFAVQGDAQIRKLEVAGLTRKPLAEEQVTLRLEAAGTADATGPRSLDAARIHVQTGGDEVELQLLAPIRELQQEVRGNARVKVRGDLARWQRRLSPWTDVLDGWQMAGAVDATTSARGSLQAVDIDSVAVALRNCQVRGAGLNVNEPSVDVTAAGRWESAGRLLLRDVKITSATLYAQAPVVQLLPDLSMAATIDGDLARLRQVVQTPAPGQDPLSGRVAGPVSVQPVQGRLLATADLKLTNLVYGPPTAPLLREASLALRGRAQYDGAADRVVVEQLELETPALKLASTGSLAKVSSSMDLTLAGNLSYDLEKLAPILQPYLGPDVKLLGRDTRSFRIAGPLVSVTPVSVTVGQPAPGFPLKSWNGEAALAWQSAQAYGCVAGPGAVQAKLADGWIRALPVDSTLNQGRVHLTPTLRLDPAPLELNLARGDGIDRMKLTPAMCAGALGFALPALAKATEADGELSLALEATRLPSTGLAQADITGQLTIHSAKVGPGPLARELAVLLKGPATLTFVRESIVPFRVVNGRVHHQNLQLLFPELTVKTSGSVGLDGSVDLVAEFPVPPKWLPAGGRVATALASRTIRLPIRGTLSQPKMDAEALRHANAQVVRDAAGDALKNEAEKRLNQFLKPRP